MNRSLLLLAFMPLLSLAENSQEGKKQLIDPGAPTFNKRVVDKSFTVYEGEPTETSSSDKVSEITERDFKLKLLARSYRFTATEKEGKVMYGFPIKVQEVVCGDLFKKNGGLFWGDLVVARHFFRYYTMYNANTRSQVNERHNGPCMSRMGAQDHAPTHYFDENYSEKKLSEKEKLQAKLGASLLKKLIEANKQDSSVTALPVECTDIKE